MDMSPDILINLVTVYGPLGLGWVMYLFERRRVAQLSDRSYEIAKENVKIMTEVSSELHASTSVLISMKDRIIELVAHQKTVSKGRG